MRTVFAFCVIPFVVLAALNSGGYRYGASDQAFYQPAVLKQLDPALFPRDTMVLAAQTQLTAADEVLALIVRATGASVPVAFAALYVAALALFAWGVWHIGRRLYRTSWAAAALLAAFTLRHAIARSGTNTLEGYFQPRLLAYALGAVAIAAFLRGRLAGALALILAAGAVHPTTAAWFAVWLGVAAAIAHPGLRKWLAVAAVAAAAAAAWALTAGPLAGRLTIMDPEWRRMLASKNYLFPLEWPAYAWFLNLGYLPVIIWLYRVRRRAALVDSSERALVLGVFSLAVIFAGALVLQAIGVILAFQLQPARVFWMFDFVATVYGVWLVAEGGLIRLKVDAARFATAALVCLSAARGAYVVVQAERPAVQISIPDDDWGRVMGWARTTDKRSGWLADPLHAVLYGTSVRVAGERDVLVEAVKDSAIGMYDRRIAVRTDERITAAADFRRLTADRARRLGAAFDLDFLVTEQTLELPLVFESGPLRVYRLE
ncbi:MAG TPA: hypothetical protein VJ813_09380 [Vicinamibacterales bacterium]|nr:hypothetical protein [Vicinamibacterales bacterium]